MNFKTFAQAAAFVPLFFGSTLAANSTACNNSPSLCSKSYGNITHLGAHDSPFLRDSSTSYSSSGNQYYNSTVQLEAGVRLLTAQVHEYNNSGSTEWHLCHSSCSLLDAGKLSDWLSDIKTWMDSNTNDVVTVLLVNSDDATASELASEFSDSGIDDYAYTPDSTSQAPSSWPTLQEMIDNSTRLVTFVASLDDTTDAPYLLDEFTFVFENPYDNTSPSNFTCEPERPTAVKNDEAAAIGSGRLFLMNHFLYQTSILGIETPDTDSLNVTNAESGTGSLGESATECSETYGTQPWGVLVDFFNVGPAIDSVDSLNNVTDATGRKTVSTAQLTRDSSSAAASVKGSGVFGLVVAGLVVFAAL